MANPWDSDPVVGGNPWDDDPVVSAPKKPQATKPKRGPDFSNVQSRVRSTESTRESARTRKIRAQSEGEAYRAKLEAQRMEDGPGFFAGMGYSFDQTMQGAKQFANDALGVNANSAASAADSVGLTGLSRLMRENVALPAYERGHRYQQQTADMRQDMEPMQGSVPSVLGNITGTALQFVGPGVALRSTAIAPALLPRTVVGNALQGAAFGAVQPVESQRERGMNTVLGGALPATIGTAGNIAKRSGVGARNAIDEVKREAIDVATREGIPLHASQVSDSIPAKTVASMARYLPFSGAGKAAQRQQGKFNQAVSRTFGADAEKLTDDVMTQARRARSAEFEEIYNRNDIRLSPGAVKRLVAVESEASRRLTIDEARVLSNQLDDILKEAGEAGVITGQKYQALRTQIMKAESADKVGNAVKDLRKTLDDIASEAVGPKDAAALKKLRSQWANFRTTEGALKQVSGAMGDVRPASLWPAIRNGSTKEMRDLARVGQTLLKDPIPDSGSPGRLLAMGGLLGGTTGGLGGVGMMAGSIAAGATAGRVANSSALARLMVRKGAGNKRAKLGELLEQKSRYSALPSREKKD